MDTLKMPKSFRIYLPLIVLWGLLLFVMPRITTVNFDYKKGASWMGETLVAQFDFPVQRSDDEIMAEYGKMLSSRVPYYMADPEVIYKSELMLNNADLGVWEKARPELMEAVHFIYSKGVIKDLSPEEGYSEALGPDNLLYVQRGKSMVKVPVSEIFTLESAKEYFRMSVATSCFSVNVDSLLSASGLTGIINPDLQFDQQMTNMINEETLEKVSSTNGIVRSGQVIVREGEIVTAEIELILDSYRDEYARRLDYGGSEVLQWIGLVILSLSLVLVLFLGILFSNADVFNHFNKYLYILLIFFLSVLASSYASVRNPIMFYMIPYSLIALYLLAFFKRRVVFTVYFISILPVLLFAPNGVEMFLMYLVAGVVCILVFGFFNKGWLQFVTAFIVFLTMVVIWVSFECSSSMKTVLNYYELGYMALGAFLTVTGYPMIFLFEKMFALVSQSRLVDLCDTSNQLLRTLADKAPGTFQHSLQVMNLADAAARKIDANVALVRAGALYHDIGKITNPQCYTENEVAGVKYHQGLSPKESAREIIKHVSEGLALADKHNLPKVIKEFISCHHGTSSTGYFLTTYLNAGGDPADTADFYYDGIKPVTKEHVILMICDSVEAASRSLKAYTSESIDSLVDSIVTGRIEEGQLSEAEISLQEINLVKDEIKSYLLRMYHSRIAYPKRQEKTEK